MRDSIQIVWEKSLVKVATVSLGLNNMLFFITILSNTHIIRQATPLQPAPFYVIYVMCHSFYFLLIQEPPTYCFTVRPINTIFVLFNVCPCFALIIPFGINTIIKIFVKIPTNIPRNNSY